MRVNDRVVLMGTVREVDSDGDIVFVGIDGLLEEWWIDAKDVRALNKLPNDFRKHLSAPPEDKALHGAETK